MKRLITYSQARNAGLKRYFTGKPCPSGHIVERLVSSQACFECAKARAARRRNANPEIDKSIRRLQYASRQKQARTVQIKWRKANPNSHKHINIAIRARRLSVPGRCTRADLKRIYQAQSGRCAYCRIELNGKYQVDHIHPLSKPGGTNFPRNIQLTCAPCNNMKSNRDPIEFAQSLGLLL